jgi:hypothetical protein
MRKPVEGCCAHGALLDTYCPECEREDIEAEMKESNQQHKTANQLTCVYCGMSYPEGTPPYGSKVLTDHIKVCEKHPMAKLRKALVDIVGSSDKEELERMETVLKMIPDGCISGNRTVILKGIRALLETM